MGQIKARNIAVMMLALGSVAACGAGGDSLEPTAPSVSNEPTIRDSIETNPENTIWSLFRNSSVESTVSVN